MKPFKIALVLFLLPLLSNAQVIKFKKNWQADPSDNVYARKRFFVQLDYGLNNVTKLKWTKVDDYGDYRATGIGPASLKIEYALKEKWGVLIGANFFNGKASWRVSELDTNKEVLIYDKGFEYDSKTIFVGANTHIFTSPTVDIYLGGHIGYTLLNYKPYIGLLNRTDYEIPEKIEPWYYSAHMGFRLNYSRRSGIYFEAGQSTITNICVGMVYRLGL